MEKGIRFDQKYETMPWHHCDAVVFDIGNVLILYAPDDFLKQLFPGDEEKQKHMLEHVYRGPYWPQFDLGTMEYTEAAQRLHEEFGYPTEDYMHALTGWIELKRPIEEGWRAARRCKRAGMHLYLLSNYPLEGYARLREKFADLFEIFEGGVISSHVHMVKPNRDIYEELIRTCHLEPSRTLFIDDTLMNVEGAMDAGINGFHMSHAGAMDDFFI